MLSDTLGKIFEYLNLKEDDFSTFDIYQLENILNNQYREDAYWDELHKDGYREGVEDLFVQLESTLARRMISLKVFSPKNEVDESRAKEIEGIQKVFDWIQKEEESCYDNFGWKKYCSIYEG